MTKPRASTRHQLVMIVCFILTFPMVAAGFLVGFFFVPACMGYEQAGSVWDRLMRPWA